MSQRMDSNVDNSSIPLLVDLDGSLIKTDTLFETAMLVLSRQPWLVFMLAVWFLRGKPVLKRELSRRCQLNVDSLPYNESVIDYCRRAHDSGRSIILCTGSWHTIAERIAEKFDWISDVAATDSQRNLTGVDKAQWAIGRFGERGFDYLGNSRKDLLVWQHARQAIVLGSESLVKAAEPLTSVEHYIPEAKPTVKVYAKAIRVHQWAKNSLVFVPLVTAHLWGSRDAVIASILAFFALSLVASATYLLNDLFDLEADRLHSTKCKRPLAAGLISIPQGVGLGVMLMALALLICQWLNGLFLAVLVAYLVVTIAYSFKLKRLQSVDVLVLACLFTVRVIAGTAAIEVEPSFWLLGFSMFIFFSLALVKRVTELIRMEKESQCDEGKVIGRGYFTVDTVMLQSLGGASGLLSVLVFALYINTPDVKALYTHPELLWLMCPVLAYWIMRIWILTVRDEMHDDPISFAIKDVNSIVAGAVMVLVLLLASWL